MTTEFTKDEIDLVLYALHVAEDPVLDHTEECAHCRPQRELYERVKLKLALAAGYYEEVEA